MHSVSVLELVPAGVSLPEHECAAPDGARFVLWHCIGLRRDVLGRLYSRVVDLSRCVASLVDPLQFVYESLILATLAIWVVYCIIPEPARRPVLMPASSTIYRWNEIASALGHTGTKVAVQQPANSFFLSDVERVVEKVLARNMKGRESET